MNYACWAMKNNILHNYLLRCEIIYNYNNSSIHQFASSAHICRFTQRQTGRLQSVDWRDRMSDVWRASHSGGVIVWVTPDQPAALKTVLSDNYSPRVWHSKHRSIIFLVYPHFECLYIHGYVCMHVCVCVHVHVYAYIHVSACKRDFVSCVHIIIFL